MEAEETRPTKRVLRDIEREAKERVRTVLESAQNAANDVESRLSELDDSAFITNGVEKALTEARTIAADLAKKLQAVNKLHADKVGQP